ncbi:hypothetical protein CYY_004498 [Polysphondylium violaceum]|uniref:Pentatricopeptide repeat-containing protein n=1 Tax=Polysphondylium violaceum TaxID=133409 RepID=A0A8J4PUJ3_9MYCE|nr:hypothetical protein CYY_004498 [Polysphondylium violaceum]
MIRCRGSTSTSFYRYLYSLHHQQHQYTCSKESPSILLPLNKTNNGNQRFYSHQKDLLEQLKQHKKQQDASFLNNDELIASGNKLKINNIIDPLLDDRNSSNNNNNNNNQFKNKIEEMKENIIYLQSLEPNIDNFREKSKLLNQIYSFWNHPAFKSLFSTYSTMLINMYLDISDVEKASNLFCHFPPSQESLEGYYTFHSILLAYIDLGLIQPSIQFFQAHISDYHQYLYTKHFTEFLKKLHQVEQLVNSDDSTDVSSEILISFLTTTKKKMLQVDIYTSLAFFYFEIGEYEKAETYLNQYLKKGGEPNFFMYYRFFQIVVKKEDVKQCRSLLKHMIKNNIEPNYAIFQNIFEMCVKLNDTSALDKFVGQMYDTLWREVPYLVLYNSMQGHKEIYESLTNKLSKQSPQVINSIIDSIILAFLNNMQYERALEWLSHQVYKFKLSQNAQTINHFVEFHSKTFELGDDHKVNKLNNRLKKFWETRLYDLVDEPIENIQIKWVDPQKIYHDILAFSNPDFSLYMDFEEKKDNELDEDEDEDDEDEEDEDDDFQIKVTNLQENEIDQEEEEYDEDEYDEDDDDDEQDDYYTRQFKNIGKEFEFQQEDIDDDLLMSRNMMEGENSIITQASFFENEFLDHTLQQAIISREIDSVVDILVNQYFVKGLIPPGAQLILSALLIQTDKDKYLNFMDISPDYIKPIIFSSSYYKQLVPQDINYIVKNLKRENQDMVLQSPFIFNTILYKLVSDGHLEKAIQLAEQMLDKNIFIECYNTLLYKVFKALSIGTITNYPAKLVDNLFKELEAKELSLVNASNCKLLNMMQTDQIDNALAFFSTCQKDSITFNLGVELYSKKYPILTNTNRDALLRVWRSLLKLSKTIPNVHLFRYYETYFNILYNSQKFSMIVKHVLKDREILRKHISINSLLTILRSVPESQPQLSIDIFKESYSYSFYTNDILEIMKVANLHINDPIVEERIKSFVPKLNIPNISKPKLISKESIDYLSTTFKINKD